MIDKDFLTVEQVMEILQLGRNKTYGFIHAGEIPSIRFGHLIRVPKEALYRELEKRMEQKGLAGQTASGWCPQWAQDRAAGEKPAPAYKTKEGTV